MTTSLSIIESRSEIMARRKLIVNRALAEHRDVNSGEAEEILLLRRKIAEIDGELSGAAARAAVGRPDTVSEAEADFSDRDLQKFSVLKLLKRASDKLPLKDGVEAEMSAHIERAVGKAPRGIYIPSRILARPMNAIVTTTTGAGALSTVTTSEYIDALRSFTVAGNLGCTFLRGLQGNLAIPRVDTDASCQWVEEGGNATGSSVILGNVTLSPRNIIGYSDFTRTFLNQTSVDVEQLARNILFGAAGGAFDAAVFNGSGAGANPLGALNNTNCNLVTLTTAARATSGAVPTNLTGGALTWAAMIAMRTAVSERNVAITRGAYVVNGGVLGQALTLPKVANYPAFIAEGNMVGQFPIFETGNIPSSNGTNSASAAACFGNWPDCLIGQWGGIDLLNDPYSLAPSGGIRILTYQTADVQFRHPEAFSRMFGIKT